MDDTGTQSNIDLHVYEMGTRRSHDKRFDDGESQLAPSRWWFASSAFPMIAGTLGPVASAFSICALVQPWRQHVIAGNIEDAEFEKDPAWLLIVNGIQLVVALLSNVFLLLNMARRVRFSVAQPLTIVGWYISSICLMSLNATAAVPLVVEPQDEYVWSQAFWYGMWAAILYFVVASLMVITVYGAYVGHYAKDFMLTTSQRTLMLQSIMVLLYLLVGALVFSSIEGWSYLDAVYWADVTLFTVGFGDLAASTSLGRALLIPYALVGVISLGLVIGSIRSMVVEHGRHRLNARMVEKKRRKVVKQLFRKGEDGILKPIRVEENPNTTAEEKKMTEYRRREEEFNLMRMILTEASARRRWLAMAVSTGSWLVLWLVGAKIFQQFEQPYQQWTYFEGFYFTFVTLTTIGYGDRTPVSNGGKSFFVFWSLLALPTMTVLISNAGDTVVRVVRDVTLQLGNITILPGERGFKRDIRRIIDTLSMALLFKKRFHGAPPGVFSSAQPVDRSDGDHATMGYEVNDQEDSGREGQSTGRQGSCRSSMDEATLQRSLPAIRDPTQPLPDSPADYHYILISEIAKVTHDLKRDENTCYSFAEWAWYMKLIGEDESRPETHRIAHPESQHKPKKSHRQTFAQKMGEEGETWRLGG